MRCVVFGERTAQAIYRFYAMVWKVRSRTFIRLIGGFILSKSGVIYTHANIHVYLSNSNISSNCIIIKTMEAATRSDGQCDEGREYRGTRVWSPPQVSGHHRLLGPQCGSGPVWRHKGRVTRSACGPRITGKPDPPHKNHHIPTSNHKTSAPPASSNQSNSALSV